MVIGITGSSGSGKTTVCEIISKNYNSKIIKADEIAKELSQKGKLYYEDIIKKFGIEILLENGEIDRKKLADIIYNDNSKREELNELTFKYVCEEIKKEIKAEQNENTQSQMKENFKLRENYNKEADREKLIIIDAPLLLEAKLDSICDTTIAVISKNKQAQIERILNRDGIDKNVAIARMNAQKTNEFYAKNCDYEIINDGDMTDLEKQVKEVLIILLLEIAKKVGDSSH